MLQVKAIFNQGYPQRMRLKDDCIDFLHTDLASCSLSKTFEDTL